MKGKPLPMKQTLLQAFSPSASADRTRRRRPAVVIGAVVLMWWMYLVLGANLPWLLGLIAASAVAVRLLRHHRQTAACVAVAVMTAAVPAVTCVILIDRSASGAPDVVAVLTGYILVAPIPALVACTLRPALVNPAINALLGSGALLLGASPSVLLGDHGEGPVLLVASLVVSVALIRHRQRRAAAALLAPLPLVNGWTDLGRRVLPDGSRVEQLLIGNGNAIACSAASSSTPPNRVFLAATRTAAATATALGLAGRSVQPVILTDMKSPELRRYSANDGEIVASVIVTGRGQLDEVIRLAPRRLRDQRRAVLTAALLPCPAVEATTR